MTEGSTPAETPRGIAGRWFAIPLWKRIFAAMLLGAIVGFWAGESAVAVKWIGDIFVRLIRMLVVPLVFVTIASGVAALGDPRKLGAMGARTLGLYALLMMIAACVGVMFGALLEPGAGVSFAAVAAKTVAAPKEPLALLLGIIPVNPVQAMAEGDTLAVIFFALLVGAGVIAAGPRARVFSEMLSGASEVMLRIVGFAMEVAPFGVFALIAVVVGANGAAVFAPVLKLGLCVIGGSLVQTVLVHGGLVRLLARLPALPFFRGIADAMMVGFSTASSSAALPVAMRVAEDNLGIGKPVASTVLPLGAVIGMDGAALYVGALAMFSAQAFGIELGLAAHVTVALTTALVAMGVGPVPSGSLFVLAAVLATIGITPEQTALVVGFVLPFDRLLDMTRTIPNVTADLAVATVVGRSERQIDLTVFASRNVE